MTEKTNILFLDDEPVVLDGLRRQLTPFRKNWNMRFESSPVLALESFDREPADVVVTDIKMQTIKGDTIANLLASLVNPPGIVVLSDHVNKEELQERFSHSFEYLSKPCNPVALVFAVSRVLRSHPSHTSALLMKFWNSS